MIDREGAEYRSGYATGYVRAGRMADLGLIEAGGTERTEFIADALAAMVSVTLGPGGADGAAEVQGVWPGGVGACLSAAVGAGCSGAFVFSIPFWWRMNVQYPSGLFRWAAGPQPGGKLH